MAEELIFNVSYWVTVAGYSEGHTTEGVTKMSARELRKFITRMARDEVVPNKLVIEKVS